MVPEPYFTEQPEQGIIQFSSIQKGSQESGAGAAPGASKPPAGPKEGTPVFQGDRGGGPGGHQKPSVSGYARGQRGSSQGRSPGQRQSERYSKDTEADTRMSEMVKNG